MEGGTHDGPGSGTSGSSPGTVRSPDTVALSTEATSSGATSSSTSGPAPRGATPDRGTLIQLGLPLVRRIAFRMARRLPPRVEADDLISAGTEGLLKAIDNYDPSRTERFESYAESRIRGAILDELRGADAMTRYGRQRATTVARTIRALETELGTAPEPERVAEKLGIPLEQYQEWLVDIARGPALGRLGEVDPDQVESSFIDPCEAYDAAELRTRLASEIGRLPERLQQVLALYYQHECTQQEIGRVLGITESRVCQLLGEAAVHLRARLAGETPTKKFRQSNPRTD